MEMAEGWTKGVNAGMLNGTCCYWTITDKEAGRFIGVVGISIYQEQDGGELHYWIGAEDWNKGYCTEASKCVISHVFETLNMHRLAVTHRENNLASKTVVTKCGFVFEGSLRDYLKRFDKFENVYTYSMLKDEYLAMKKNGLY
jgi:RimJ/RimL family protein N-acetyltransferase